MREEKRRWEVGIAPTTHRGHQVTEKIKNGQKSGRGREQAGPLDRGLSTSTGGAEEPTTSGKTDGMRLRSSGADHMEESASRGRAGVISALEREGAESKSPRIQPESLVTKKEDEERGVAGVRSGAVCATFRTLVEEDELKGKRTGGAKIAPTRVRRRQDDSRQWGTEGAPSGVLKRCAQHRRLMLSSWGEKVSQKTKKNKIK